MRSYRHPRPLTPVFSVAALLAWGLDPAAQAEIDLGSVPLFDAEQDELANTWGGSWGQGNLRRISLQPCPTGPGRRTLCFDIGPTRTCERRFAECFCCDRGRNGDYYQSRDLGRYERLEFDVFNETGVTLDGLLLCSDDCNHRGRRTVYRYPLGKDPVWTHVVVPLSAALAGSPDLSRLVSIDFAFQPESPLSDGRVYVDKLRLIEKGGPVNVDTRPLSELVERLTRRQWDALWTARSRVHGLVPNVSYQTNDAGLNATAAVLWMLPAAERRHWVAQEEGLRYVEQLLQTVDWLLDRSQYLPPRNVDWVTLEPSLLPEESAVDAAFLALALRQYARRGATPRPLAAAIERTVERFDFAVFASPRGWRMAYRYESPRSSGGLVDLVYDGYTNEGRVISLAAHLARRRHVPIETYWNAEVHRVRAELAPEVRAPVVHRCAEFRAPFAQAILNLFVDVRTRGHDGYPDPLLAANPWQNFVDYEESVMATLARLGRSHLAQPDAGDDGTTTDYRQFSLYDDGGKSDLFMPWSASFVLLTDAHGAEDTLRCLLRGRLHGPFGLADSARWTTGDSRPYAITPRTDFWNTALSTMALLEWLDGDTRLSKSFAALPEVTAALDRVFRTSPEVAATDL